ncbi:hypothetical protein Tco_0938451 [Tanacetum coccineum]|uniref:Uncharacterized protein n=1 Tax=Tanacetum coccineum TaxID=301880 RepID=A0ABQ5DH85_9ASTR
MQRGCTNCPMNHSLHSVHSLGRDEELAQTKQTYGTALTKLIKKVEKLEQTVKSTQARRRFRIVVSDDEEDEGTSWIQEDISDIARRLVMILRCARRRRASELVEDQWGIVVVKKREKMLRYHAQLNRPYSVAEVRKNMVIPLFEKDMDQIQSFAPMDSEKEKDSEKKGSRKKSLARKEHSLVKKQSEGKEFSMEIESLDTKYPIVDWKTHDVMDYTELVRKVMQHQDPPEGYDLMLWEDLKILFQPVKK